MVMKIISTLLSAAALAAAPAALYAQDEESQLPDEVMVPVADDDLEAAVDAEQQVVLDYDEMKAAEFARYKSLIEAGSLDEADGSAKRLIEIILRTDGPKSADMAKALTNLAIVQHRSEEFEAAQQNFEAAIEIIEDNEDRLNAQLVNPLSGLAAAQLGSGRPDLASATYGRAVHLTHVNEGPHNLQQVDLLESMAEVQLQIGDLEGARETQKVIYAVNVRAFAADSMELVPALMRRAAWQHRAGLILDEQSTYRHVIRIIEELKGKDDLALVKPRIMLGRSYFFPDRSGAEHYMSRTIAAGETHFKQALRIAKQNRDAPWILVADAMLALGDFYMYSGAPQRARSIYSDAWLLLSEPGDEARAETRRNELERSVPLKVLPIRNYVGTSNPMREQSANNPVYKGSVTFTHGISKRGMVTDVRLVEANPPEFVDMQTSVQREMRRRIYRPVYRDGEPIAVDKQVFVHSYWYRQSDLDALRNPPDPEAAAEADDEST